MALGEDCTSIASTPTRARIFESNPAEEGIAKAESKRKTLHHIIVAKLLFVAMKARPDIQAPVPYLTSRVTQADEEDWKKLKRILQHINATIDMEMTLSIYDMSIIKTWQDASSAVHDDMRSHTGANITTGKGTLYARSMKQN